MKKQIILFIFVSFFINVVVHAQNNSLTLKEAISIGVNNNPGIKATNQVLESCSHSASAAKGRYLPRIDVVGLANKIDKPVSLDFNDIRTAIISADVATYKLLGGTTPDSLQQALNKNISSFEKKVLNDTFVRVMATFIQPVFTGFKVSANASVKKLEKEVAEINLRLTTNSVISSIIEDYYRVKLVEQVVQIRKDYLEDIEKHVDNAKRLYSNGMISKANYLRAEVALSEAQRDYKQALADKDLILILLSNNIGRDIKDMVLSSNMEILQTLKSIDYYESKAEANNDSLKLLDTKKQMLKQKHKVSVGNLLPNISLTGEYQILQNDLSIVEPKWVVGAIASLNIFGGDSDINEIKAIKAQINAIDSQSLDVKNIVRTGVKNFYHKCEAAKNDYEALQSSEELAKENLKLYQTSFKEGLATSLEVLDAELAFTKIKVDQAKAIFDYNSAYANLLNICSILQEEEFSQ
jgi:outer membrane protein TolC